MSTFKRPLAVGDRVAVYTWDFYDSEKALRLTGKVKKLHDGGSVQVSFDAKAPWGDDYGDFHPRQCVRLVKKERRRLWARFSDHGTLQSTTMFMTSGCGWIEFREVRPRATEAKRKSERSEGKEKRK